MQGSTPKFVRKFSISFPCGLLIFLCLHDLILAKSVLRQPDFKQADADARLYEKDSIDDEAVPVLYDDDDVIYSVDGCLDEDGVGFDPYCTSYDTTNTDDVMDKRRLRFTKRRLRFQKRRLRFNKRRLRFVKRGNPTMDMRTGLDEDSYLRDSRGPRLRFVKRDLSEDEAKHSPEVDSKDKTLTGGHSRKRRSLSEFGGAMSGLKKRQFSFSNDLTALRNMLLAHAERQTMEEQERLRQKLLETGKRSGPTPNEKDAALSQAFYEVLQFLMNTSK